MKTNDLHGSEGPKIEPTLLLRFLIKRCDELLKNDNAKLSLALQGLSLASVFPDDEGYAELKSILFPSSQVRRCRDVLVKTLSRTDAGEFADPPDAKQGERFPSLPEQAHRNLILTALREGKKITCRAFI